jgi:uncharacterized protein YggE
MSINKQFLDRGKVGMMGLALVAVSVLATGCSGVGLGTSGGSYPANQVSVTGSGDAYGTPDVAYVDLGIDVTNSEVSQALNQANQTITAVQDAVKKAGVAEEDIQTTNFSVYPQDSYDPQTGQPTGQRTYHVQNVLHITVRDVGKVGSIIDAGTGAGANTVQSVTFGILDTAKLAEEARTKAIADARERAQQLADGLGVKLGTANLISETYGSVPVTTQAFDLAGKGGGAVAAPAPVSSGQLVVTVQVNVTFNITP